MPREVFSQAPAQAHRETLQPWFRGVTLQPKLAAGLGNNNHEGVCELQKAMRSGGLHQVSRAGSNRVRGQVDANSQASEGAESCGTSVHWHLWSCSPIGSHQSAAAQPGSFICSVISLCFPPQQSVLSALPLLRNSWPQGLCPSHLEPETMKIKHAGSFLPPPLMV